MKQVLATLLLLLLIPAVQATNNSRSGTPISAAEYFIDVDPGFGSGQSIPITGGWNASMDFSVSTTGLRNGTHWLYVRTQNSDGTWGIPQSKMFIVQDNGPSEAAPSLTQAEYFIDSISGTPVHTALISSGSTASLDVSIPTTGLRNGTHRLYVRTQNSEGTWGIPQSKMFIVQDKTQADPTPTLTQAEYYIDNISGTPVHTALISSGITASLDVSIPTTGLRNGTHRLYVRTQNSEGTWGIPQSKMFIVQDRAPNEPAPDIIALKWFFDQNSSAAVTQQVSNPGISITETLDVPLTGLSLGAHNVRVQALNSDNVWGIPQSLSFNVVQINHPPTINMPPSLSINQNESLQINMSDYVSDPDADPLYISVEGNTDINVSISGMLVSLSPRQNWTGTEQLTFVVNDYNYTPTRDAASDVVSVIVTNPLLVDFSTDSGLNNNAVAGDPLTELSFSATANFPISSYAWDFDNDGITDSTLPNPSFIYPNAGLASVKLVASDGVHITTVLKEDYILVHPGVVVPPAVVNQNIVWTEEGGPYNITGEVLLNPGYSLTIEPNAQVNLLVDNQLVINGSLNASEANFTAYGENGWGGIVLGSTATNSVISGITVLGAATGFTINDCDPVLSGITMVGAENLRTPGNAVVINGASAPVMNNINISNFANGIKANNPGLTAANLNFSSVRINRGTLNPSAGDTGIEINGNYVVEIDSALVVDYNHGVKIDSSNINRARAKLTNVRVIKTESNNRNNSIAFNLQNLNQIELVCDSLSGFDTGILISNPNIAQSSLLVRNCHISRVMAQNGMETGIKLLGNSNGTIDSIYVANYSKAIELNGNHSVHVNGSRFENCGTLLHDTQNNADHSIKGSIAYRNGQYSGANMQAAFNISSVTGLSVLNNTIHAYPSLLSASNASSAIFSQNIAWSNNPAASSITLSGGSSLNASYNDIAQVQGVYPGQGNINSNPMFENPSQANFALNVYSPCIDAGNPANPLDPDGSICDMGAVTFNWATAPLIADFYTDVTSGQKPLTVQFTDHSTRNSIAWQWDFDGDGIIDSTIQNPTFVYNNQGVYGVSLVVFDGVRHSTKYIPNLITALNSLPHVVQTIENINVAEDFEEIEIDLSGHFADVNGDPISYNVSQNNGIVALSLEGSVLSISSIADLYGTTVVTVSATEATLRESKRANYNTGSKSAEVYSREDSRASISFSVIVSPVNDAPSISLLTSYEFDEDESMVLDLSACVSDVDSQNLSVSVSETTNLICEVNGLMLNISALPNWFGSEQITVTVNDNGRRLTASATTNIIVHPVNDAPTINLLTSYEFDEDESMVLDLSACVSDVDSQNLSVSVSETTNLICEVNGLMLNISALPNWFGSEQITVTVNDNGRRLTASATTNIIVHPVNDAPTINLLTSYEFDEDESMVLDLSACVSDVDSQNLSVSVSETTNLICEVNGLMLNISALPNWFGSEQITVTVNDIGRRLTASATTNIIVHPVNDAPTINLLTSYEFDEDESMVLDLSACVSDVDSQNLSVSVSETTNLICEVNGLMLNISALPNWFGSEQITVTVNDNGRRLTASATTDIIVHPVNDAPIIISYNPAQSVIEVLAGTTIEFAVTASDVDSDLGYEWWVGGSQMTGTAADYSHQFSIAGTHAVVARISDEINQIEQEWSVLVSVSSYDPLEVPAVSGLSGCYPNPCAVSATIKLGLSAADQVDVSIYNSKGQLVTRLVNDSLKPGMHSINWDTCDNSGNRVSNGIYFVKASTSNKVYTEKLIVLK